MNFKKSTSTSPTKHKILKKVILIDNSNKFKITAKQIS